MDLPDGIDRYSIDIREIRGFRRTSLGEWIRYSDLSTIVAAQREKIKQELLEELGNPSRGLSEEAFRDIEAALFQL